mmetsp:Transcript_4360/g.3652  ORF Transcript_4360/g.3652 Transcript_4360/m.3652 type:complete len:205 (+) Transcript_4360:273-887(+)
MNNISTNNDIPLPEIDSNSSQTTLTHLIQSFFAIFSNYFSSLDDKESCYPYSTLQVFAFNYTLVLAFFLGCSFTHLQKIPIPHLSLSVEKIKYWGMIQYLFIGCGLTMTLSHLILVFVIYYRADILFFYLCIALSMILLLSVPTFFLRKTHSFHFHHYVWAMMLMIMAGNQNPYISIVGSIHSGIMVEGIARWGADPWWYPKTS